ncbi:MAG TPA: DUF3987 domain-containing protein [Ktedonobacteraceae bacterium]|nr:DUF3987 domain-containing protein [Ktedonobacteraceae bacterium]
MAQRENSPQARISEQQAYVQALRTRGAKPSDQVRPSFGNLEPTIRLIEEVAEKSNGHIGAIERTITTLQRTNPALAALLEIHRSDAKTTEVTERAFQVPPLPEGIAFAPEVSQGASPWLDLYEQYSREVSPEGYDDFHLACGLWVLSTVAARRVYVPLSKRIYTPLAIALTARTSLFAKTTTASAAITVLQRAGLAFLLGDDETTPQKLLADMAGCLPANYGDLDEEQQARVRLRVAMSGQRGWYYDEFGQAIAAMMRANGPMADFSGLLRRLDDCRDSYAYSTRTYGQEVIDKPYLALLANMTPADLRAHAGKGNDFWRDGFWARFAFITPPEHTFKNASFPLEEVPVPTQLLDPLRRWHARLGMPTIHITVIQDEHGKDTGHYRVERSPLPEQPCQFHQEAYRAYDRYRLALRELIAQSSNQDLDGSYTRLSDRALRITILLASLENGGYIELRQWAKAQEIAEMMRSNLHELYRQVHARQEEESLEDILLNYLKTLGSKKVTIREIRQFGPSELRKASSDTLRNDLLNLMRSEIVTVERVGKAERYALNAGT